MTTTHMGFRTLAGLGPGLQPNGEAVVSGPSGYGTTDKVREKLSGLPRNSGPPACHHSVT